VRPTNYYWGVGGRALSLPARGKKERGRGKRESSPIYGGKERGAPIYLPWPEKKGREGDDHNWSNRKKKEGGRRGCFCRHSTTKGKSGNERKKKKGTFPK